MIILCNPISSLRVYLAYLTNNAKGKTVDVNGRDYRSVYRKFGFVEMLSEYQSRNTWGIS